MTSHPRRVARATLGAVGAMAVVVFAAAPAQAHARVVRTTPGNGATVDGHVGTVSVVFDDPVQVVPRSLVISGSTGAPEPIGAPRVVGGKTLVATVTGRLPAGRYFVGWRILSDDGHIESGTFAFAVGSAAAPAAPSGAAATGMPAPAEPTWPVVVAAVMAGAALLGAGLVVIRGLAAVRRAAADPYSTARLDGASARDHALMRH